MRDKNVRLGTKSNKNNACQSKKKKKKCTAGATFRVKGKE